MIPRERLKNVLQSTQIIAGSHRCMAVPKLQGQRLTEETKFAIAEPKHWARQMSSCDSQERCLEMQCQWTKVLAHGAYVSMDVYKIYTARVKPSKNDFVKKNTAELVGAVYGWDDGKDTRTAGNTRQYIELIESSERFRLGEHRVVSSTEPARIAALGRFRDRSAKYFPATIIIDGQSHTVQCPSLTWLLFFPTLDFPSVARPPLAGRNS
jgi:hypothetical protein